jgi:hypothetical protein
MPPVRITISSRRQVHAEGKCRPDTSTRSGTLLSAEEIEGIFLKFGGLS